MTETNYDVIIIGAGVTGCAIARELSRYDLNTCVLEKCEDVCSGTSKANSAIVHGGFDARPGTLKAKMNVAGSKMMEELSKELDFDYRRNGSMVLCFDEQDLPKLQKLYDQGIENGVEGLSVISGDEARSKEPNLSDQVVAALDVPTGAIICPFGLTIALAENACDNGMEFRFLTGVDNIEKCGGAYRVYTENGCFTAKCVVNAAGVFADRFHNMVSSDTIKTVPRKGEYLLLDKEAGSLVSHTIFQLPTEFGKGVLVTPTVHGNLMIGPTAVDIEDKENTETSAAGIESLQKTAAMSVKNIPFRLVITSFCGLRAHEASDDFILGEVKDAEGFFDAAGIESPGLSSAPAIGQYLAQMVAEKLNASLKPGWNGTRKGIVKPGQMPYEERARLIRENPDYGSIVCRCEGVSEGEIVDAITRTLGATSLDGLKRRVRQGMGRCQAGFCTPRAMEILSRETGKRMEDICKNMPGSEILTGSIREDDES